MDKPIQAGDLVVTIKPRACGCGTGGTIFLAEKVELSAPGGIRCAICGDIAPQQMAAFSGSGCAPLWRLKRIPPLSELDEMETAKAKKDLEKLGWPV